MRVRIEDNGEELTTFVVEGEPRRPFVAGDLEAMSAGDLLAFLNSGGMSGRLVLLLEEGLRKIVYLLDGEVVYATSNAPGYSMGDALFREGLLEHDRLLEVESSLEAGSGIDDFLVESGEVTVEDLYRGASRLARDVVISMFSHDRGEFYFTVEQFEVTDRIGLGQSTHELILRGFRSADEVERLRMVLPLDSVFDKGQAAPGQSLSRQHTVILGLADGARTGGALVADSRLGAEEGLRALNELLESSRLEEVDQPAPVSSAPLAPAKTSAAPQTPTSEEAEPSPGKPAGDLLGALAERRVHERVGVAAQETLARADVTVNGRTGPELMTPPPGDEGGAPAEAAEEQAKKMPFVAYTKVISRLCAIMQKMGKSGEELDAHLSEKAPAAYRPIFDGVRLESGALDMPKVISNGRRLHGEEYRGRVLEALEDFQSYALFEATRTLPPEVCTKVQRLVMLIHLGRA